MCQKGVGANEIRIMRHLGRERSEFPCSFLLRGFIDLRGLPCSAMNRNVPRGQVATYLDEFLFRPPRSVSRLIQHTKHMSQCRTCQGSIAVAALKDRYDLAFSIPIGERGDVPSVAREERRGHSSVVPLHALMFVFTSIKAGTKANINLVRELRYKFRTLSG